MRYTFGACELDTQQHVLRRAGQPVHLRPKAFAVLVYLVEHRDRVVTRDELCVQVWPAQFISDATLGSTLRAVRQAIGDRGEEQQLIQTVHGYGYRCVAPVMVHTVPCADLAAESNGGAVLAVSRLARAAESVGWPPATPAVPPPAPDAPPAPGERKVVTVLCCALDITASGGGPLDLDTRYGLLQACYARIQDTVQQYGGTLQPLLGDRVLALFGVPMAQEDHAVRAGFAALTVQQHCDAWWRTAGLPGDVSLAVRMGLHTGLMVVGSLGTGPALLPALVGDVTAQAVALQEHAAPGTVLCSAATVRLVQGRIHCTPVALTVLAGQSLAAHAYMLHRASSHPASGGLPVERVLSPFVGREREMAILHALLGQVEAGRGQVVGVVGEAGVGKSRLVAEFCASLVGRRLTVCMGWCCSYGSTTPYLPVLELLRHACGLTETDPPDVITAHVHQYLQAVGLHQETWAPVLLHLLGLQESPAALALLSPEARKARIMTLLTQLWLQASRQQPLLLIVEDLHWSDPSSEAWLTALVERLGRASVLLLGTYRPGYLPGWLDKSYVTQVALPPLTEAASRRVVQAVLPPALQTTQLVPQLLATAEGNPLFLEELARTVVEQGATAAVPIIPETIHAVLLARLDRLPATAKRLLQAAAVIGKDVAVTLLQGITDVPEEVLQHDLAHLQTAEFLYETGLVPEPHYTFKHVLTQEVTYQSLLRPTRQQYHTHIAQVLEARFPTVAAAQPELLAHHYTEAGLAARAIPYWQRAGERAIERSANLEALRHLTKGLEVLQTLPETPERSQQELVFRIALGAALMVTKGYGAAEVQQCYTRAWELSRQVKEHPRLFQALCGLHRFYLLRAELQSARELGMQLLSLGQRGPDPALLLEAHRTLGHTCFWLGEFPIAREHIDQGMTLYDPRRRHFHALLYGRDPGVDCYSYAAVVMWFLGYPDRALQWKDAALTLARELSHPFSLASASGFAGFLHTFRREGQATREQAEATMALATEQGFAHWFAHGMIFRGWALAQQGEEGIAQIRQGMAAWRDAGEELARPYCLALLAEACARDGLIEEGLSALAEALAAAHKTGERFYEAELYRLQGELLLAQSIHQAAEAETCFCQALAVARHQQAKSLELRAAMSLARLWRRQGKRIEARELLAPIYNWFMEGFDTADLQEAKTLLDELQ